MKLIDILDIVKITAKENNLSTPYIVGGFPRDIILKKIDNIKDVDITCGDKTSLELGHKLVNKLKGANLITFSDMHSRLTYGNICLDFSNNFKIPDIENILKNKKIKYNKEIYEEIYSRDFTINTLLMPTDISTITDITNRGIKDISDKILDTVLEPEITLHYDPKRIIRVVYLCCKLNFKPSKRIIDWIRNNGDYITKVNNVYIKGKINNAYKTNRNYAIELINSLKINDYIPQTKLMNG